MTRNGWRNFLRNEDGVTGVVMGLSLLVLAGFAALALDLGVLHLKRSTLQTSADAAALAGANALIAYGPDLPTIRGIALDYARSNLSDADSPTLAAQAGDVAFYRDGAPNTLSPNQVEVTVRRVQARSNPVSLLFGRAIGLVSADLTATARAGITATDSSKCLKPFAVPTKFTWDDQADPSHSSYYGNGKLDPESAAEMASVQVQGYGPSDIGTAITLKNGDPHQTIAPGQYNAVDFPPVNKGSPEGGA